MVTNDAKTSDPGSRGTTTRYCFEGIDSVLGEPNTTSRSKGSFGGNEFGTEGILFGQWSVVLEGADTSTGESPFTLLYGRDARVPTSLDFYHPTMSMPVLETDYARELFKELKQARQLAQKTIEKSQGQQKVQ